MPHFEAFHMFLHYRVYKLCEKISEFIILIMSEGNITETDETSSICLNSIDKDFIAKTSSCGHSYHLKCIREWSQISLTCAVCRTLFLEIVLAKSGIRVDNIKARTIKNAVKDRCFESVNRLALYLRIYFIRRKRSFMLNRLPIAQRTRNNPKYRQLKSIRESFDRRTAIPYDELMSIYIGQQTLPDWNRKVTGLLNFYANRAIKRGTRDAHAISHRIEKYCDLTCEYLEEEMQM